jgi:16S rRNA (uracil1498-N3)-methyltransferase
MNRFFLSVDTLATRQITFPSEVAHQVARVLRLRSGQQVIVLDNRGFEYVVELTVAASGKVTGTVLEKRLAAGESGFRLVVYMGLTQRDKFEWTLQKCTEMGAAGFVPVVSSRTLVQVPEEAVRKSSRWKGILREAAEQSGRGLVPTLYPPARFAPAVRQARQEMHLALLAWEGETVTQMDQVLTGAPRNLPAGELKIGLFIGPEGGFSDDEVGLARQEGVALVSLGRRILRMETAAVAACTLIMHYFDEM